jgi:hypothetical protein
MRAVKFQILCSLVLILLSSIHFSLSFLFLYPRPKTLHMACNYYLHILPTSLGFLEIRFSQLADERNHKVCTDANKKELLQSKLNRLRMLKDDIAKDAWMFDS